MTGPETRHPSAPKIVHAVHSLDFGGLERVVLDLVRNGRAAGSEVGVICLDRPGTLAKAVEDLGAELVCVNKPPGRRPEAVEGMARALSKLNPDVIHSHQIGVLYYLGPAARRVGAPAIVHTEHINHAAKRTKAVDRLKIRALWALAGRHAARFCCVSADIAEAVAAFGVVPRRKLAVVPNGIDTTAIAAVRPEESARVRSSLGIPEGAPIVGTVGRLAEVKRQDVLLRSFAAATSDRPDARLVLVGDGPERQSLEALSRSLGISDRVHFAGYQSNPEHYLAVMDIFALTSRLEGMPLAILEAWAAGLPVVASAVGGVPDLVEDGRTGRLFAAGDEPKLANLLADLLADAAMRRRLGESGRTRAVAEFDVGVMAAAYDRHYREVLASRGAVLT